MEDDLLNEDDELLDPSGMLMAGGMPNVPRDPEKEARDKERLKAYLQPRMERPDRGAENALMQNSRDLGLINLFAKAANQAGTVGGKAASSEPMDQFTRGLQGQNQQQIAGMASARKEMAADEDRRLKMMQYLEKQGLANEDRQFRREQAAKTDKFRQESLDIARNKAAKEKEPGADERKFAAFATRALSANQAYEDYIKTNPGAANISTKDYLLMQNAPTMGASYISPKAKMTQQLEKEFIGAVLRPETGAAASDSEWAQYGRKYFPRPGDTPEILARKAALRKQDIDTMRNLAGKAAGNIPADRPREPAAVETPKPAMKPIVVSNGKETYEIDPADLKEAEADGFREVK